MEKELKYLIDGEPVDFRDIIRRAKKYGYDGEVLQSSIAADFLRKNGHTVEENPNYKITNPNDPLSTQKI